MKRPCFAIDVTRDGVPLKNGIDGYVLRMIENAKAFGDAGTTRETLLTSAFGLEWNERGHFQYVSELEAPTGVSECILIKRNFFGAATTAYSHDLPLVLRPETIASVILKEVALEIRLNQEIYRHLFTDRKDKQEVIIRNDRLYLLSREDLKRLNKTKGDRPKWAPWNEAIVQFQQALRERMNPSFCDAMTMVSFSTDTESSRLCRSITLLDAASQFYSFKSMTLCGIPRIELDGLATDWRELVALVERLAPFLPTLSWYFESLHPVLSSLADAASGKEVPMDFWQKIYTVDGGSGREDILSGWITALIAHVGNPDRTEEPPSHKPDKWKFWEKIDCGEDGIPSNFIHSTSAALRFLHEDVLSGKQTKMVARAGASRMFVDERGANAHLLAAVISETGGS